MGHVRLLGREEVVLDREGIRGYLHQKRILVTGAGGSVGSELVRQITRFHPKEIALLDVSELNLFQIEMECLQRFEYITSPSYLTDVRHYEHLEAVFEAFRPDVVFHAAAYKHVPMQERHPWEAVFNNVLGTRNVAQACLEKGSHLGEMTEAIHVAVAIRGGASLVHGLQMQNVATQLSM